MKSTINRFLSNTKENPTLKRILLIIALHAIAPAIFIILYLNLGQRETTIRESERNLIQIANYLSGAYNHEISHTRELLSFMADLPILKSQDKEQCEILSRSILNIDQNNSYLAIGAVDKDGNSFCSTIKPDQPVNVADRTYFQEARDEKRFVVGGYTLGKITSKEQIPVAFPIFDDYGDFAGAVIAGLDVKWLDRLIKNMKLTESYSVTAIDQNGFIIGRYPDSQKWLGQNISTTQLGNALNAQHLSEGVFTSIGLNEVEKMYAFTETQDSIGEGKITVLIGAPKAEILRAANQNLVRDITVLLGIIGLAVFIVAFDLHFILRKTIISDVK